MEQDFQQKLKISCTEWMELVYYTKQKLWHLVLELLACSLKNSLE